MKTKKGKSKGIKKGTATNGSATPNGVHGGLTTNTRDSELILTKVDTLTSSKKRNLDPEVRQSLMAECTTIRGPLVDYRMLGTRNSSLSWQAIVISQLPAISFHLLSTDNLNLGCRNKSCEASTIAERRRPNHTSRLSLDVSQKVLRHCLFLSFSHFCLWFLSSILVCLETLTPGFAAQLASISPPTNTVAGASRSLHVLDEFKDLKFCVRPCYGMPYSEYYQNADQPTVE
jgi:hypothetical protein